LTSRIIKIDQQNYYLSSRVILPIALLIDRQEKVIKNIFFNTNYNLHQKYEICLQCSVTRFIIVTNITASWRGYRHLFRSAPVPLPEERKL
jgi:hypothetical protein